MKKTLFALALLATVSSVSIGADTRKEKKAAKAKAKSEKCGKMGGHACCMKKTQA